MSRRRDIDDLQQQIQELFSDLWQVPRFSGLRHGFRPSADCYRTDEPAELHVVVELPGIAPDSMQIVVSGLTLIIAGVRERPHIPGARVHQLELDYGPFQRHIQLSEDVNTEQASATYEHGLLEITLPLAPVPQQQERIPIPVRRQT